MSNPLYSSAFRRILDISFSLPFHFLLTSFFLLTLSLPLSYSLSSYPELFSTKRLLSLFYTLSSTIVDYLSTFAQIFRTIYVINYPPRIHMLSA